MLFNSNIKSRINALNNFLRTRSRKSPRKRSKFKTKSILTLSIIVILAISTVSLFSLYNTGSKNSNNQEPPTDENPTANPTAPPTDENPTANPTAPPTDENPTTYPNYPNITLNKQIPPGYTMGFPVDAGLNYGMNVVFIHNSDQKISIRFTAKQSGTVTKLVIYAYAYSDQPTVRVGLQEDSGGNPNGQWINENTFGTIQLPSSSGFKTIQLQASATVVKDQSYHIVIEAAENPLNGSAAFLTYKANSLTRPFNSDDPDILSNDAAINTLYYNGYNWQEENKWPIFVVLYLDGKSEGQPYSIAAPWVVYGSTYVGQTIIPASNYKVGKIAFYLSLKANQPQDKLYYQIRDANNNILSEGIFAQPDQLTVSQKWIEATLPTPVLLEAGKLYRIIVLSPQTDLANAYHIYGHEFCYNPLIGYGGLQHQLTSSLNGGATWGENKDADAIFKLTTTG